MIKYTEEKVALENESCPIQNEDSQQNLNENNKNSKTKKALRKLQKREKIAQKKNTLPEPKNVHYIVDDENDCIIVKGEVIQMNDKQQNPPLYLRFKLSGQEDFLPFGYQAKIPLQASQEFQFEVLQVALLEQDEIAIQIFDNKGKVSAIVYCHYQKKDSPHKRVYEPLSAVSKFHK